MRLNSRFLLYGVFALVLVLSFYFVMAAAPAPTGLIIRQNVTPVYDEGTFFVNWTSGGLGSNSYNIYVHSNNIGYLKAVNDTATGYFFSNTTTEANYTFIIEAVNTTGNANSTTNISIYVDRTAPVITLPHYTNGTVKKNTQQLILNVSITDANSGLTGTRCIFEINGTNQTIAPSGSYCNISSLDLTNLADGNQTIKVWVNDTVNILGLNNSFVVQVDAASPTATASCSPSTIYEEEAFPCTCSGTDSTSTVTTSKSSTSGSTTDTSVIGTYTFTCTVTDSVENSASDTEIYTVLSIGGGGATTGPPKETNSWAKITPGAAVIMKDFDAEIGIKEIQITVNNEAQNVKVIVTKHDGKPAEVSISKTGKVYQYIQIDAQNLEGKLNMANVQFRVEKTWASNNGVAKEKVAVYKFDETSSKWNEQATTYSSEDSTYYYYDVSLDSFSYFAISERSLVSGEGTTATGETPTEEGRSLTWLWVLIVAVVLVVIWQVMRKKQ